MYGGDYVLYGDFVASEDGYSVKKKKKKKKGKKKVIEICHSSNLGVFSFLAFGALTINISLTFMFSLMVDIMIEGAAVSNSVTITNNNNNNNNNMNMNMNMNTNRRRRKRSRNTDIDDNLRKFIRELNAPQYYLRKCSEEKVLSTFGFLQLIYNKFTDSCEEDARVCKVCEHLQGEKCDCTFEKFKNHYSTLKIVCNF